MRWWNPWRTHDRLSPDVVAARRAAESALAVQESLARVRALADGALVEVTADDLDATVTWIAEHDYNAHLGRYYSFTADGAWMGTVSRSRVERVLAFVKQRLRDA